MYKIIGTKDKPAVFLLHGFLGSNRDWEGALEFLDPRFCYLVFDLPGHGDIGGRNFDDVLTFEAFAAELEGIVRAESLSNAAILGYSLGARLALHTVVRYPDLFKCSILESVNPGINDPEDREERKKTEAGQADALVRGGMENFIGLWYAQTVFLSVNLDEESYTQLKLEKTQNDPLWMAKILREFGQGTMRPLWSKLSLIKSPVLLIAGERDSVYRRTMSEMARLLPNCSHQILPGSGHMPHREIPENFATAVNFYLQKHLLGI